jgi:hypothetical protein
MLELRRVVRSQRFFCFLFLPENTHYPFDANQAANNDFHFILKFSIVGGKDGARSVSL